LGSRIFAYSIIIKETLLKKIDRYIFFRVLTSFVFVLFLVLAITMAIDSSEKADDFAKSKLPFSAIFYQYFLGFIPSIMALIFPLIVLITVIWTTSVLANRTEIVALFATGMSLGRLLRPYWLAGALLSVALYFSNGWMVPRAVAKMAAFKAKYIDPNMGGSKEYYDHVNHFFKVGNNAFAGVISYDTASKTSYNFFIHSFDNNNNLTHFLRTDLLRWDTAKRKWQLENAVTRTLHNKGEHITQRPKLDSVFNFYPKNLLIDNYTKQKLNNTELNEFIKQEKLRQSDQVNELILEKHKRINASIAVLILTIMGAIIASKKIRGGSGMHLVTGLVLGAMLILCDRFSSVFAVKGNLHPVIAAYLPSIIFTIYTYYLFRKAPK
jgi:lipopolysaccharide export system permease protein